MFGATIIVCLHEAAVGVRDPGRAVEPVVGEGVTQAGAVRSERGVARLIGVGGEVYSAYCVVAFVDAVPRCGLAVRGALDDGTHQPIVKNESISPARSVDLSLGFDTERARRVVVGISCLTAIRPLGAGGSIERIKVMLIGSLIIWVS